VAKRELKILALVPSGFCFGLQNLTLSFFALRPPEVRVHFLNTFWTDGEFNRRLDALGIQHSSAWIGMFSRKLDRDNIRMTIECLIKLPGAWWEFLRLYRRLRPDLIYVANHHEIILFWPLLLGLRRKVVCHMHDPPPPGAFQRASFWLWRRAVGRFLFISYSAQQRLGALGAFAPDDVVIHNGVAIAPLALPLQRSDRFRSMFNWPADAVIVGMTGQINPDKGHDDLLEAAVAVQERAPQVRFVIGGRGPQIYIGRLRQRIAARGLQDCVALSGWLERSTDFYEAIDIAMLASRHEEGFGLVLAEAGERGIPGIATASGGAAEVIADGVTGFVLPKENPQALANAIVRLAGDEVVRTAMGVAARERVGKHFNLNDQARRFFAVLQGIT
jgi:glycosyltransferase involved in cell wall biosynthesis